MRLAWVELKDFRSYSALTFEPDPGTNVFVGPNGAGKSNLLEAVSYLARLRSFRRAPDDALIATTADAAVLRGEYTSEASTSLVEIELPRAGRRRVLLNGKRPKRYADVAVLVRTVVFLPDDLALVKGAPSYRRDYLDDLAMQLSGTASGDQGDYERSLRQRNALLRQEGRAADTASLEAWDERLAELGVAIINRRLDLLHRLGPLLSAAYDEIGHGDGNVAWQYVSAGLGELDVRIPPADAAERLLKALTDRRRVDMDRRTTTVGPHRDEVVVLLSGGDARTLASQGEQRSLALGLRLAAFDLILDQTGEIPVLLLDDVFSELDRDRTAGVMARLPQAQVFITTARPEDVPVEGRRWSVGEGSVR
jgi:DNA replication and repair protein RecF